MRRIAGASALLAVGLGALLTSGAVARADEGRLRELPALIATGDDFQFRDYYRPGLADVQAAGFEAAPTFRPVSERADSWTEGFSAGDTAAENSGEGVAESAESYDERVGESNACCGESHDGCCDPCCDSCCRRRCLCGLILQSDPAFQNFVSPISNPLFFEDPRTLTGINLLFVEHSVPRSNPVLQGGDVRVWAAQIRAALTERLSIVAAKDGWININSPGVGPRDGFADLNVGLKYNLVRDPAAQFVLSAGFGYEIPVGQDSVFQGNGDGEWHFYLTGGKQIASELFWISGSGFRIPNDHNLGSQMWYWSNSFAYRFLPGRQYGTGWYAMWEINWFHWMRSGNAFPFNFEGTDLINFGSNDVAGNDIVTMFWGPKWKPTPLQEIGAGIEIPVTDRRDLYRNRVYAHWILRF